MQSIPLNSGTRRLVGCLLFLAVVCIASDCQAQHQRRLFPRIFRAPRPLVQAAPHFGESPAVLQQTHPSVTTEFTAPSQAPAVGWTDSGAYVHPRNRFDETGWERYPKWYGGFHSSHFTDLGIPAGDRGFRGNGIYWTPW